MWVGLGSNLGDRAANLQCAVDILSASDLQVTALSHVYESRAILKENQPDFLNAVAQIETLVIPHELLWRCLSVENEMGRVRAERYGPRIIDVDVLLYGQARINEPDLVIPHPGIKDRAFVLIPLLEIAPNASLPDGEAVVHFLKPEMRRQITLHSSLTLPPA